MCQCLSFLLPHPVLHNQWAACRQAFAILWQRIQSCLRNFTSCEVELFRIVSSEGLDPADPNLAALVRRRHLNTESRASNWAWTAEYGAVLIRKRDQSGHGVALDRQSNNGASARRQTSTKQVKFMVKSLPGLSPLRETQNGGSNFASLFTKQGLKGINQDAMLVWQEFTPLTNTVLCGIFDGHGPHGHLVACNVRDILPVKLASCWQSLYRASLVSEKENMTMTVKESDVIGGNKAGDSKLVSVWKQSFLNAYKLMDHELLIDDSVDCISSGTTAVTLVKQGNDLIIANVGDSRAIMGVQADDNSLVALQLTVDLTPNLPKEAERIRHCKGRVFAVPCEPSVMRVWLPHSNTPGLAMARALGDYRLKSFGVISRPEVTHWHLTDNDKFIVLATDGVWDVLSNEQVVQIVGSISERPLAAKAVVDAAVHSWNLKFPDAKADDCAVVCLFLDSPCSSLHDATGCD